MTEQRVRFAGANVTSIGDALWWAATTVTTVGYGDRYPVTTTGRVIAVILMIVGMALVSAITASIAAWFVSSLDVEQRPSAARADRVDGQR